MRNRGINSCNYNLTIVPGTSVPRLIMVVSIDGYSFFRRNYTSRTALGNTVINSNPAKQKMTAALVSVEQLFTQKCFRFHCKRMFPLALGTVFFSYLQRHFFSASVLVAYFHFWLHALHMKGRPTPYTQ